jgi:hypothetical protein
MINCVFKFCAKEGNAHAQKVKLKRIPRVTFLLMVMFGRFTFLIVNRYNLMVTFMPLHCAMMGIFSFAITCLLFYVCSGLNHNNVHVIKHTSISCITCIYIWTCIPCQKFKYKLTSYKILGMIGLSQYHHLFQSCKLMTMMMMWMMMRV